MPVAEMEKPSSQSPQPLVLSNSNSGTKSESQNLSEPANEDTKRKISSQFFGISGDSDDISSLEPFFDFYHKELRRMLRIGIAMPVPYLNTKTHEILMYTQGVVSKCRSEPRSVIRKRLHPGLEMEELSIDRVVDLTIRLWLMVQVRDDSLSMRLFTPQQFSARWDESDSLDKFLAGQFPLSTTKLDLRQSRLEMTFTIAYMVRTCRLQVKWTDDLANHLRLDRGMEAKILFIFPHKAFLVAHLKNG